MWRGRAIGAGMAVAFFTTASLWAAHLPEHRYYWDAPIDLSPTSLEQALETEVLIHKARLEDEGLRFYVSYWGDYLSNPIGGKEQASSWIQLLVFGGEFSLDRFGAWPGLSVVVSGVDTAGSNLSLKIGNIFTVSQAYVMNTMSLYDLFVRQRLFGDRLVLEIGRMSAGQYFATMPTMGQVVSGAVNGNPTSLFVNAPFHATASASWGAHAKFKTTEETYIESGAFQASPRIGNPVYHGVDFSIRPDDGVLVMAEAGWSPTFANKPEPSGKDEKNTMPSPKAGLPGLYSFGAYYSHYKMSTFGGGTADNQYGFYAMAQQMVWRGTTKDSHNSTIWGGITYSPQMELAQMPVMGFGGINLEGLIPGRDADNLLLSFYLGGFSGQYADAQAKAGHGRPTVETVLEASYIVQLTKSMQFQPDLQWIINPGGTGDIHNALVLGFQVAVSF